MKKHGSTIILCIFILTGLSLLIYPTFSNYWNSIHATKAISGYAEQTANLDEDRYKEIWEEAENYNRSLLERQNPYLLTEEQEDAYYDMLDVGGLGIMGYIEIEAIGVSLPLYHGTGENVLQSAVGHIEWSSLPTGGESTHSVLSGHRGLPSAKLFTDLDKLVAGDLFTLRILDEVLTYEVDQILIVEPQETEALLIEEGKDYCTLVTCTPYGINSHRILLRGERIENPAAAKKVHITSDAVQIEPVLVAPVLAVPLLIVLTVLLFTTDKKKGREMRREKI